MEKDLEVLAEEKLLLTFSFRAIPVSHHPHGEELHLRSHFHGPSGRFKPFPRSHPSIPISKAPLPGLLEWWQEGWSLHQE